MTPDGSKVYVANFFDNTISVIDTATNTVMALVTTGSLGSVWPDGLAVTPDGSKVYVTNRATNDVSVIDTATNTVIGPGIPVGTGPAGVAVTPDGKHVYVANFGADIGNTVSVIDASTNAVSDTISVGEGPIGVAVTPDGSKAYVTNFDTGTPSTVSIIDTVTNTVTAAISVGTGPLSFGIFIQPANAAPKFAGAPGKANCHGQSISALTKQYGGLANAAAALGYPSVSVLQNAIEAYCES